METRIEPRVAELEASDGYTLQYRVWSTGSPGPTLLLLNGIMSNARWFDPIVPELVASGYTLVGADRRGSGLNRQGWGDAPSAAQLVQDVLDVVHAERSAEHPLLMLGWCWGASLAVAVSAKLGTDVRGLVLVTPGMFTTRAIQAAMERQAEALRTAAADAPVIDSPIEDRMFTAGAALDAFIRRDKDRVLKMTPRLCEISGKLVTSAVARLRKLSAPVLLLLAEHDEATDNAATRAAMQRLPHDKLTTVTLPTKHGIQFDAPAEVAAAITAFAHGVGAPGEPHGRF